MICMNCGADRVMRIEDTFTCSSCNFEWTVADEQANAVYLRSQGREPAKSVLAVVEVPSEVTITTGNESGSGEPQKPTEPASTPESAAEAPDSKPESTAKKAKG